MIVKLGSLFALSPLLRMYAVRLETSPCSLLDDERRDHERPLGEVRDRPEVDVVRLDSLAHERGQHGEAERRQHDAGADDAAEADRGQRQEAGAAVGLEVLLLRCG